MTYVDVLDDELAAAGIPSRRRRRIVAEFTDHLAEDPDADLGSPGELARQFADELGTRLARGTAYRAFALLVVAAAVSTDMYVAVGRRFAGWGGFGHNTISFFLRGRAFYYFPSWWGPVTVVCLFAAQVALAAGALAFIRAWRLRRVAVMTASDGAILNHRAAVALVAGAITMTIVPLTRVVSPGQLNPTWKFVSVVIGPVLTCLLLAMIPDVMRAARLRPTRDGPAGDLTFDLGTDDARVTPRRIVLALSLAIVLVTIAIGAHRHNLHAGILGGLLDATACLVGSAILGRYLGLRRTVHA